MRGESESRDSPEFNSRDSSESESKNRKLELLPTPSPEFNSRDSSESVRELLPPPSPEFNSRDSPEFNSSDSSESESKKRKLEELLPTPNSSNSSESVRELLPTLSPEFKIRDSSDSSKEEEEEDEEERKYTMKLFSEYLKSRRRSKYKAEQNVYFNETEFRKEGEFNILLSVTRIDRERHEYFQRQQKEMSEEAKGARDFYGAYAIAGWFCLFPSPSPDAFLSKFPNLDAKTLKSHLKYGINSEDLGIPDWEELAKYVKQLQESDEGFDLDEYKNLANYTDNLPRRLPDKDLPEYKGIDPCMEGAMKLYENAGGGELKEGKVVKANAMWLSQLLVQGVAWMVKKEITKLE